MAVINVTSAEQKIKMITPNSSQLKEPKCVNFVFQPT